MIYVAIFLTFICASLIGKFYFKTWFNSVVIYSLIWGVLLSLYELKLFNYYRLSSEAWLFIIASYFSFLIGALLPFIAKPKITTYNSKPIQPNKHIHLSDKLLVRLILVFGLIGLLVAVLNWKFLIDKYGSIAGVFLNANIIYGLRVKGEIPESIPYIGSVVYISLFFAGIHSAKHGRITMITFLPIIAIVLKDMAGFGRANIMVAAFLLSSTFFICKYYFKRFQLNLTNKNLTKSIVSWSLILTIAILSASIIKTSRGSYESFEGETSPLKGIRGGLIISPSVYLYASSHIAVFSKYLDEPKEKTSLGQNTFLPIYSILSKFNLLDRPSDYQRFYTVPMESNTGTYLRELHADFGVIGPVLIPFLLGLFISIFWNRLLRIGGVVNLAVLTYLFTIVGISFLMMWTRSSYMFISAIILFPICVLLDKRNKPNLSQRKTTT